MCIYSFRFFAYISQSIVHVDSYTYEDNTSTYPVLDPVKTMKITQLGDLMCKSSMDQFKL